MTTAEPVARKRKTESIYQARNAYIDRAKVDREVFPGLTVTIETIDTLLLLLDTKEDNVLMSVLNAITKFMRKQEENILQMRDKDVLRLLMARKFYMERENTLIKRFALFIGEMIIEAINTLKDLEVDVTQELMNIVLAYYIEEDDDFCHEYLSVILNKCCDDPRIARLVLQNDEFLIKFFEKISCTDNPDILLHSLEALAKLIRVQSFEEMQSMSTDDRFPVMQILCQLTGEFAELRIAALNLVKILIPSCESYTCAFSFRKREIFVLQQLVSLLCNEVTTEMIPPDNGSGDGDPTALFAKQKQQVLADVIWTLAAALRNEKMTSLFFEHGLFEKITGLLNFNDCKGGEPDGRASKSTVIDAEAEAFQCQLLMIFAEIAKYEQYLCRLQAAHVTERLLDCLLPTNPQRSLEPPATHILVGLNRMMKCIPAAQEIADAVERGLITRLLGIIQNTNDPMQIREQAAELILALLVSHFHLAARVVLGTKGADVMAGVFGAESLDLVSIDLVLPLLSAIEHMAHNEDYRNQLSESSALPTNLALLLKRTFDTSVLTRAILRCLVTLIDDSCIRSALLENHVCNSLNRALKSISNLVKSDATNFIMQTTRFPEFLREYIEGDVLETLVMNQKSSVCVPTWMPALESILNKDPTYKFCIRNYLSFTDITVGHDFQVSKQRFDDFRVFKSILREDVSPIQPVICINFERLKTPSAHIITVPSHCFLPSERGPGFKVWCYCRKPGDDVLPHYLEELNYELEHQGLCVDAAAARRCIDFDNIAKRVKIIADIVNHAMSDNLKTLDLNSDEECSEYEVRCHFRELCGDLHCTFIPLGMIRTGCQFERALLFKCLADQIGLPATLQQSVNGRLLYNEVPLPVEMPYDVHCDKKTLQFMPWRLLRPTHVVDLMYNVGDLYPMQSRQALQYLRLV